MPAGVFDELQAAALRESDTTHWWFRSKAAFVASAIRAHLPAPPRGGRLVDIGAGAGGVTALIGWNPSSLFAIEGREDLCRHARDHHGLIALRGVAERLPLRHRSALGLPRIQPSCSLVASRVASTRFGEISTPRAARTTAHVS